MSPVDRIKSTPKKRGCYSYLNSYPNFQRWAHWRNLAITEYDILLRGKSFKPHGPSRMKLVRGYPDFCAQTIFKPIREPWRCIHHHRTGIHFPNKLSSRRIVLSHDGVSVLGPIVINMRYRIHQRCPGCELIKWAPDIPSRQSDSWAGLICTPEPNMLTVFSQPRSFHAMILIASGKPGQDVTCHVSRYQQRFPSHCRRHTSGSWH